MTDWLNTPEARARLAAIRMEKPEVLWVKRWDGDNTLYPKFKGLNAKALRQLWETALDEAMDANDRELWCQLRDRQADDVVYEMLREDALTDQVAAELSFTMEQQRRHAA